MNTKLWITLNEEMDMIGHDLHAKYLSLMLLADFTNDLL